MNGGPVLSHVESDGPLRLHTFFGGTTVERRGACTTLYGRMPPLIRLPALIAAMLVAGATPALASECPRPENFGDSPKRLIVVAPATSHNAGNWAVFREKVKAEAAAKEAIAWLVFEHEVSFHTFGDAHTLARELASCINEKVRASSYSTVTLIGHSVGGMLMRRAYLEGAGAWASGTSHSTGWTERVDRILLFASVNKGIRPDAAWWGRPAYWVLRTLPHPAFVAEDFAVGSDFIADTRIAWIRHFGQRRQEGQPVPHIVQFWGNQDSVVTRNDNADLEAFAGPVVEEIAGATHANLIRLDNEIADPEARWAIYRTHLYDAVPAAPPRRYSPRRVLFIVRGIRDSSNSEWVTDLTRRAAGLYDHVEPVEYGYFSAAHFAFRPLRAKTIPRFRDLYAQHLAENPLTEFDFIGHSNGTYILGHSLQSTPSMRFRHVALAAPVLPTDFDWDRVFSRGQVHKLRYDTASWDLPVGVLCPALRALGFSDVGPSGVVLFGEGTMVGARVAKVGWHDGGHGEAIAPDNREYLLRFAHTGQDLNAASALTTDIRWIQRLSRATRFFVWAVLVLFVALIVRRSRRTTWQQWLRTAASLASAVIVVYVLLDII